MILPTRRSLLLLAAGFPVALLPAIVSPDLWAVWVAFIGAALLLVGVDAALGLPAGRLEVQASPPALLYIGGEDPLPVTLRARGWRFGAVVEVRAELSDNLNEQATQSVSVEAGDSSVLELCLRPRRRGMAEVAALWLRWSGPLGLMARVRRAPIDASIPVAPNIRAVRDAALRFFASREFLQGLKMQHYVGDGSEFEALEEYRRGLDHRAIDWKASARHLKLLVREFRAERNHQVYLCFDTGHLMSEPLDGVPKLDHAINAGLLLAYVGVKTGDRVGFFAFDDQPRLFSKAQAGVQLVHRLQARSAELEYGTAETNFTVGLTTLLTRLRRRSLVVVFTDFVDTVTAELMVENVHRLSRRHLVIFVTFRDEDLDAFSRARPEGLTTLNRAVVATELAREREIVLRRLRRLGVHCIEAPSRQVSVQLINRYLEVKRREMV